jgi:quercetin dioxygenase-like cupin family protein
MEILETIELEERSITLCSERKETITMKTLFTAICSVLMIGQSVMGQEQIKNVLADIPYADGQMGKRKLIDEKDLFVMQIALKPGQQVPQHNANSNVHLLILEGEVIVTLDGKDTLVTKGGMLPVAFKTLMSVRNASKANASFLNIKSPNPSEMNP